MSTTVDSIHVRHDLLQALERIARQHDSNSESLINTILENYILEQTDIEPSESSAFLSSLAGMFESGEQETSEQVHSLVRETVVEKYAQ